jgi:FlaG/FlaF family flagellin (archaellin)
MKVSRKLGKINNAVSTVIGVILMVAITVMIAASVYVYVSGMIGGEGSKTPTLLVSMFDVNEAEHEIVWLVTGIEGHPVDNSSYTALLLNSTTGVGLNVSLNGGGTIGTVDAWVNFTDNDGDGYVNPGDVFRVKAHDGSFVFMLLDKNTGSSIFKSEPRKY